MAWLCNSYISDASEPMDFYIYYDCNTASNGDFSVSQISLMEGMKTEYEALVRADQTGYIIYKYFDMKYTYTWNAHGSGSYELDDGYDIYTETWS